MLSPRTSVIIIILIYFTCSFCKVFLLTKWFSSSGFVFLRFVILLFLSSTNLVVVFSRIVIPISVLIAASLKMSKTTSRVFCCTYFLLMKNRFWLNCCSGLMTSLLWFVVLVMCLIVKHHTHQSMACFFRDLLVASGAVDAKTAI